MVNEIYDPEDKRGSFGNIGVIQETVVVAPHSSNVPASGSAPVVRPQRAVPPMDFLVKDDGDFVAGPGEFIPVPKTRLRFRSEVYSSAFFFVQASFGWSGFSARHDRMALLVDDVVYAISEKESISDVGSGVISEPSSSHWAMNLAPGEHSVQIMIRGSRDEGQVKTGLWLPCRILANRKSPLVLSVLHG